MKEFVSESRPSPSRETSIATYIAAGRALQALSSVESEYGDSRECVLDRDDYYVRPVTSATQLQQAGMLISQRYSWRGYHLETAAPLLPKASQVVLGVSRGEHLFGTLTVGLDSDTGLLADALYKEEVDTFRRSGGRVCDVSRFAIAPGFGSKEVLGALFYVLYLYARIIHRCTDMFAEVNPRHARFYVRMLGFREIGAVRLCPRVDAPAVLLHIKLAYMGEQIARHYGGRDLGDRSLYPYFLSECETRPSAYGAWRREHLSDAGSPAGIPVF